MPQQGEAVRADPQLVICYRDSRHAAIAATISARQKWCRVYHCRATQSGKGDAIMTHDTQDTEGDVPESVGMVVMRCADCELIHIGMIDAEDGMICEMMLDDADVMRMAMQLLFAV